MRSSSRQKWLRVHRYLGLSVGLWFVLVGLTGSILVFDHAIDEWLNPSVLLTEGSGPRAPIEQVVETAEAHFGESALSVSRPRVADGVWTVWFSEEVDGKARFTAVHVDPYTPKVTGQRVWGQDLLSWIYRLHFRLLVGATGGIIVGILGLIVTISLASGIYLWWPLFRHSWRAALAVRTHTKLNYDLHKLVGVVSAAFLLVITLTGVYMEFPVLIKDTVGLVVKVNDFPEEPQSSASDTTTQLTADQALNVAREYFPHAEFDHLHPPSGPEGAYEVAFRQPHEVQRSYGRTQVFLDPYSGEVLEIHTPDDFTAADTFFAWQFPLHNGEAFGLIGRWCVFSLGFTPAILYSTGLLLWWRRWKSSGRRRRPAAATEARIVEAEVATDRQLAPEDAVPV